MSAGGIVTAPRPDSICAFRLLSPQDPPAFRPTYQPFHNDSCAAAGAAAARIARDAPAASSERRRVEMIVTGGPSRESRGPLSIVAVAAWVSRVKPLDLYRAGARRRARSRPSHECE